MVKEYSKIKFRVFNEEHIQLKANNVGLEIGKKIQLILAHICTTVNLYDYIHVIKDNQYIGKWKILARGKNY
jgi:D-serine deaminase-like pyridoxal phosphate-dependent protein